MDVNSIVNLDAPVVPVILAEILGITPQLLYKEAAAGRLPTKLAEHSYRECIQRYVQYLKQMQEVELTKERNAHELKMKKAAKGGVRTRLQSNVHTANELDIADESLHPLLQRKIIQEIKSRRVTEVQTWLRVANERREVLVVSHLQQLLEPFILVIKNVLVTLAIDFPDTRDRIDQALDNLYKLGCKVMEETGEDEEAFLQHMLDLPIDAPLGELGFVPNEGDL